MGSAARLRRARGEVAAAERGRDRRGRLAHDRQREHRGRAAGGTRCRRRTAWGRRSPSPAATSVTAASPAVVSRLPVPPPFTNSSSATSRHRRHDGRAALADLGRRAALERRDHAALQALAGRPVADAGDVPLVGHQPDELDAGRDVDLARERRPPARACGSASASARSSAGRPRSSSRRRARSRPGSARTSPATADSIRSRCATSRPSAPARRRGRSAVSRAELRDRRAVGGRVADARGRRSRAREPQRLRQRVGQEAPEARVAREDPLEQRRGSAATCSRPGSACPRRGAACRRRCATTRPGRRARTAPRRPRAPARSARSRSCGVPPPRLVLAVQRHGRQSSRQRAYRVAEIASVPGDW